MRDASKIRTKKLYDEDAYARSFSASVLSLEGEELILDATLFFPEEGGQCPDRGTIEGIPVVDVQIVGREIRHKMDPSRDLSAFVPGKTVRGEIDFAFRFSNMQQHSGEHLLSGVITKMAACSNVGFHLSAKEITVDYDVPLAPELLAEAERRVNAVIVSDIPSRICVLEGEELRRAEFRSKLEFSGPVRVVTFPGCDSCACCAPHVRRTGEIGLLKIMSAQRWKGGTRLTMLCGSRAMELLAAEHDILQKTARCLSASPENIPALVQGMKEGRTEDARRLSRTAKKMTALLLSAFPKGSGSAILFTDGLDRKTLAGCADLFGAREIAGGALFSEDEPGKWSYILYASGEKAEERLRVGQEALREAFGARGGGRLPIVQGSLAGDEEEIREALDRVWDGETADRPEKAR